MAVATLICTALTFVIKDPRCTGNARIVNEWRMDPLRNKGKARTTDARCSLFSSKSQNFGLRQTNWADMFWGIWGIFGRFISTHFGTVIPLSMSPMNQQTTRPLYPHPKYLFGIGI